jgi:hypothetical protein
MMFDGGDNAPVIDDGGDGLLRHLVHEREVRHDFNVDGKTGWVGLTVRGRWLVFVFIENCLFTMETR